MIFYCDHIALLANAWNLLISAYYWDELESSAVNLNVCILQGSVAT